jgi:lantibiotic modifying enzyme
VAEAIASTAVHGDEAVGWLGLELVDERQWIVLPLGAGLPHGAGGVALFLGELAALGGGGQYADLARSALAGLPSLLNALEVREDLIAAIGPGHPHGLAGIAGAARRLAVLLDDPVLAAAARHADTLTARSAVLGGADGGPPGIAARLSSSDTAFEALADHPPTADLSLGEGEFGLLEALAAWSHRDRRAEAAHARRAAAVIARVDREGPVCATPGGVPTPGLWHGLAGIGLGLLRVGFRDRVPAPLVQNPHHPKEDECLQSTHPTPPKNRSKTRRASPARG